MSNAKWPPGEFFWHLTVMHNRDILPGWKVMELLVIVWAKITLRNIRDEGLLRLLASVDQSSFENAIKREDTLEPCHQYRQRKHQGSVKFF